MAETIDLGHGRVFTVKDGYEKQPCEPCKGTGRVPKGTPGGYYRWKSDRREKPLCSECGGMGCIVTRRRK